MSCSSNHQKSAGRCSLWPGAVSPHPWRLQSVWDRTSPGAITAVPPPTPAAPAPTLLPLPPTSFSSFISTSSFFFYFFLLKNNHILIILVSGWQRLHCPVWGWRYGQQAQITGLMTPLSLTSWNPTWVGCPSAGPSQAIAFHWFDLNRTPKTGASNPSAVTIPTKPDC